MLRSSFDPYPGIGRSRPGSFRLPLGLRAVRPVRQPRLGVCAFKDWFTGLVYSQKEVQSQPQTASQATTQEQLQPSVLPPTPKTAPKRDFLEARQVSLFQLFDSSDYKFDIPPYQRPYAWRTKHIYELVQDFVRAYETRQEYFLGAIVATRATDGVNVPYQLIDGQQRLTSLVLLLAFLHGWARQQGNEVLEGRIGRMLYLEADPLEAGSNGRYRLRLRESDDEFFRSNVLDAFLPQQFRLAGLAAAGESGGGVEAAAVEGDGDAAAALPLENETWWRLYENASFLRSQLDKLVSEGLNLQDFAFHVLRNCFVVLMVARDEGASFRIFSTLNGRGMDLSVVDKLKADLLAGELTQAERSHFADAWAEMESVLGRAAFHRVFDYLRELAAVRDPWVRETSVLEYFTRRVDEPAAVKQVLQVALDYARLLLQLRQASWAPPEMAAQLTETPAERPPLRQQDAPQAEAAVARSEAVSAVVQAALEQVTVPELAIAPEVEDGLLEQLHEQHRTWQGEIAAAAAASEPVAAEVVVSLEAQVLAPREELKASPALEPAASSAPAAAALSPPVETDNGVVVFRFDDLSMDPSAAAAALGPAAAVSVAPPAGTRSNGVAEAEASSAEATSQPPLVAEKPLSTALPWREDAVLEKTLLTVVAEAEASLVGDADEQQRQQPVDAPSIFLETEVPTEGAQMQEELPHEAQQDQPTQPVIAVGVGAAAEGEVVVLATVLEAEAARQAALLAELDTRSRHLNLFTDEAWLPPLLEFFYQTDDLKARVAFMKGAEALQLLLELQGDPALKATRWGKVSDALLQRPFRPEKVLTALRLTDEERAMFRTRLDSKDLYGTADQRTLRHLLVRCEPPAVCRSPAALGGLLVERVVPPSAPEGSLWRKTRISSPCDPQSPWPEPWFTSTQEDPVATAAGQVPAADDATVAGGAALVSYDVKYWYEVQRLNWHGKLGNLVLLPATVASAASASADYDAKAALWRQAGVASRLPGFTGPLVDERGRYGRFRFCYDECRQRHADMLAYLIAEFEL